MSFIITFLGYLEYFILDNEKEGKFMYNYGGSFGSSCGCGGYNMPTYMPYYSCGNNNSNFAIILVLFILLVIVIGSRTIN